MIHGHLRYGGSMGGSRGAMQSFPRRGPVPLANEWEVSDQWLQLVFDMADGSALAELERSCRMFDMTNQQFNLHWLLHSLQSNEPRHRSRHSQPSLNSHHSIPSQFTIRH